MRTELVIAEDEGDVMDEIVDVVVGVSVVALPFSIVSLVSFSSSCCFFFFFSFCLRPLDPLSPR
jgi:hypothetical protein